MSKTTTKTTETTTAATTTGKKRMGFAAMDPQRQREIASAGGRRAHESGRAHEFTSEEARAAGRKGGLLRASGNGTKS